MQSVEWAYYGNDSTYTNRLANYGTKFAADNWMHKMMGIQLGLTESGRCKLPEGTDGTGYWILTVHALGYQDYVVKFQATAENIAKPAGDADSTPLENIIAEAKAPNEADYTPESWAAAKDNIANELEECEEMLANIKNQTTYGVEEQIGHLREALNMLVKAPAPTVTAGRADCNTGTWQSRPQHRPLHSRLQHRPQDSQLQLLHRLQHRPKELQQLQKLPQFTPKEKPPQPLRL